MDRKYRQNKEHTNNWERERQKLRRLCAKQTNIRDNYLHQTTRFLVNLLPNRVVMESLDITSMMKNKYLAKEIAEQKWYEFTRQMQYKCEWAGIKFVKVDQYYPSSKTCSHCGHIKKDLKLSDRVYVCTVCGLKISLDSNDLSEQLVIEKNSNREIKLKNGEKEIEYTLLKGKSALIIFGFSIVALLLYIFIVILIYNIN